MKRYTKLSYRFYVAIIYFIMGIVYLLYTGVGLTGRIGDFLNKNHRLQLFFVALGYFMLSILYINNQNVYKLEVEETKKQKYLKLSMIMVIVCIIIYYMFQIKKNIKY